MNKGAQKLGANIKRIRTEKGMSQSGLCVILKLDRAYMSNMESGKKNPTLATIEKIANALKVTVEQLIK